MALSRVSPLLLVFSACSLGVDPDQGRFSCSREEDCGAGYECRSQVSGGGRCFPFGVCHAETCDGADDDCDGATDEDWDFETDSQHCGGCGVVCGAGSDCSAGHCRELACGDGLDNDGDGPGDCADTDCFCHN